MKSIPKDPRPAHRVGREGRVLCARALLSALAVVVVTGCSLLPGKPAPAPSYFTLEPTFPSEPTHGGALDAAASGSAGAPAPPAIDATSSAVSPAPPILVAAPSARAGFDGRRMAYVKRPFELRYFARHQWVEPPARLLEPLLVLALERGGRFRPVTSGALVDPPLRVETEIVALQQEFDVRPSRVRFSLRARLVDRGAGRLLASTELEALEPAGSDDPYGGVVAANRAVARVLEALAAWCDAQVD